MQRKKLKLVSTCCTVPELVLMLALISGACRAEIWESTGGPPWDEPVLSLLNVGTTVYAGMGEGKVYQYNGAWKEIGVANTTGDVEDFIVIGTDIYAAVGWSLYAYDGSNWYNTDGPRAAISGLAYNGSLLFVGGNGNISKYNRNSNKWTEIAWLPHSYSYGLNDLAYFKDGMYAASDLGVYIYDDSRNKWISTGCPTGSRSLLADGDYLYAGRENIYRYDGTSWSDTGGLTDDSMWRLARVGDFVCAGSIYGCIYKYDGASWLNTGRPHDDAYHIWSLVGAGDVAYAGTFLGLVYRSSISCGDKFSLGTGIIASHHRFNIGISLAQSITRPSNIYFLVEAPPYGVYTIFPDGSLERGIQPIYRGVPGLAAPLSKSIRAVNTLPAALKGKTLTFYLVSVDAGKIPPVPGLAALDADSPYVNAFDKRSAVVE
jgi:hypothetical protein